MARQLTVFSETIMPRFSDVWVENELKSDVLIFVFEDLIGIAEKFGNLFESILYNMRENVCTIRKKFEEDRERFQFGKNLLKADESTSNAATWLWSQTNFFQTVFEMIAENDGISDTSVEFKENLKYIIKTAYSLNLADQHGWLGSQLINVLVKYVPSKKEFFGALMTNGQVDGFGEALVRHDLRTYSAQLTKLTAYQL